MNDIRLFLSVCADPFRLLYRRFWLVRTLCYAVAFIALWWAMCGVHWLIMG